MHWHHPCGAAAVWPSQAGTMPAFGQEKLEGFVAGRVILTALVRGSPGPAGCCFSRALEYAATQTRLPV